MADWNTLVLEADSLDAWPEPAVARLISYLYGTFGESPLKIWDMGCGRGRHSVALASLGLDVYASDYSQNAIGTTKRALEQHGLQATLTCSELYDFPFEEDINFNGIICWNVLQHAPFEDIRATVQIMTDHIVSGGCVLLAVCSTTLQEGDLGEEVEEGSYILDKGRERGVLHHFFSEKELFELFDKDYWSFPALAENLVLYHALHADLADPHIFRSTGWLLLAQRK